MMLITKKYVAIIVKNRSGKKGPVMRVNGIKIKNKHTILKCEDKLTLKRKSLFKFK
tara:strand:- start:2576 stop:2743 length:168 start_codon:yes stop_codon:yes gene_type:complete